jgi:hypothetical protein
MRECEHDDDCPQIVSSMVMRCNNYNCVAINHEDSWFVDYTNAMRRGRMSSLISYQNICAIYLILEYFISCYLVIVMILNNK